MGCDIHTALQKKKKGSDKWEFVYGMDEGPEPGFNYVKTDFGNYWSSPFYGRSYMFFSFLAGVRDYGESWWPVGKTNGWPEDLKSWYIDDREYHHSQSHITLEHLKLRLAKAAKLEECFEDCSEDSFFTYWYNNIDQLIGTNIDKDYNYRLIFSFDS